MTKIADFLARGQKTTDQQISACFSDVLVAYIVNRIDDLAESDCEITDEDIGIQRIF